MGMQIQDGTGNSYGWKINSEGKGQVTSDASTGEHHASMVGDAYIASMAQGVADTYTMANADTGPMLHIVNDNPDKFLVIEKVIVSADTAGIIMKFLRNMTVGSLGDNTAITPANSNTGSSKVAAVTCNVWDETGVTGITGLTAGTDIHSFILDAGTEFHPIAGFLVLPQGGGFTIDMTNGTGGAVEVTVGVRFYFEAPE